MDGLPATTTLRYRIFVALCEGTGAPAIVRQCRGWRREDVVTVLGKEKKQKAPLWLQDEASLFLTTRGRRAARQAASRSSTTPMTLDLASLARRRRRRPQPQQASPAAAAPAAAAGKAEELDGRRNLRAGGAPHIGMCAEVKQWEQGLIGSRFKATITDLRPRGDKKKAKEALVRYDSLFDSPSDEEEDDGIKASGAPPERLQEWVMVTNLAPPPPPPPPDWHERLQVGDEAEALHEGGWWRVAVRSRVPPPTAGELPSFVVEALGYGVTRTVKADGMRPLAA